MRARRCDQAGAGHRYVAAKTATAANTAFRRRLAADLVLLALARTVRDVRADGEPAVAAAPADRLREDSRSVCASDRLNSLVGMPPAIRSSRSIAICGAMRYYSPWLRQSGR